MTKERLRNYRALLAERRTLESQIEAIEATLYRPKVPRYGPQTGGRGSTLEDLTARHLELLELYQAALDRLAEELRAIETAIDSLPPRERTVIRLYYVQGLTWEEVCVEVHYSWRQTHNIHAAALKRLKESEV